MAAYGRLHLSLSRSYSFCPSSRIRAQRAGLAEAQQHFALQPWSAKEMACRIYISKRQQIDNDIQ